MATLRTVNLQHPDSTVANLVLNDDGTVDGPGAGGLVAVKHVLKTNVFSASTTAGGRVTVTGLEITHAMADASHKLIISAHFGVAAVLNENRANVGIVVEENGTPIGIGDADGVRSQVGAGGFNSNSFGTLVTARPSVTFVHEPNTTDPKTYTVVAVNMAGATTNTVYVNRDQVDSNSTSTARAASALVIQEVKV